MKHIAEQFLFDFMATPSQKSPAMESFLTQTFGVDRRKTIIANKCISCESDAIDFPDELSRKEYTISGLCAKCQKEIFG